MLYDTGKYKLATPGPMTPEAQGQKAQEEFAYWLEKGDSFFDIHKFCLEKEDYNTAAFQLHQATESYYSAQILSWVTDNNYDKKAYNKKS